MHMSNMKLRDLVSIFERELGDEILPKSPREQFENDHFDEDGRSAKDSVREFRGKRQDRVADIRMQSLKCLDKVRVIENVGDLLK